MTGSMREAGHAGGERTIPSILVTRASMYGGKAAILAPEGGRILYGDLADRVGIVARRLRTLGVTRSARVLVLASNTPDTVVTVLGAMCTGVAVPVDPAASAEELRTLSMKAQPILAVGPGSSYDDLVSASTPARPIMMEELLDEGRRLPGTVARKTAISVGEVFDEARPGDVAVLMPTSGSVAEPRLVALSHGQYVGGARRVLGHFHLSARDRCINLMPLFHNHGLNGTVVASLVAGASVMCPGPIDLPRIRGWTEECEPTWWTAAPSVYRALCDAMAAESRPPNVAPLRFIRSASAPLPLPLMDELESVFQSPVIEIWGLTEAAGQVTANPLPPGRRKRGSVGCPQHGFEVRIVDETGDPCPPGMAGEVVLAGGDPSYGYFDEDGATSEVFSDGRLRTRDVGLLDDDGYLFITGRTADFVNRGGEKIWLPEVDAALTEHPGVREAIAFAVPHPRLGEDVAAAVVRTAGSDVGIAEIRNFIRGRLAPHKRPSRVEFVGELPLGPTGKPQRRLVSELLAADPGERGRSGRAEHPPSSVVEAELSRVWCAVLDVDHLDPDEDFLAAGGDSILATRLVAGVSAIFNVDVPVDVVFRDGNTIAQMAKILDGVIP